MDAQIIVVAIIPNALIIGRKDAIASAINLDRSQWNGDVEGW